MTVGDYNNDGFDDLFITYWGQNVLYHNNGDGTFTDVTEKAGLAPRADALGLGLHVGGLRSRRPARSVRRQLPRIRRSRSVPKPGENPICSWKGVPVNCGPRGLPPGSVRCTATTATARSPTSATRRASRKATGGYPMTAVAADFDNDGWPDIYVACDSTPELAVPQQSRRHIHARRGWSAAWRSTRTAWSRRHGRRRSAITTSTATWISSRPTSPTTPTSLYRNDGKGILRRRHDPRAAWRGDALRRLGRRDGGSGQRRQSRSVPGDRQRLSRRSSASCPAYPFKTPRVVFRNLGNGKFEELIEEAGPGVAAPHSQPRLRVRRLRQRRRRRHPDRQYERAAVTAAQRRHAATATG